MEASSLLKAGKNVNQGPTGLRYRSASIQVAGQSFYAVRVTTSGELGDLRQVSLGPGFCGSNSVAQNTCRSAPRELEHLGTIAQIVALPAVRTAQR